MTFNEIKYPIQINIKYILRKEINENNKRERGMKPLMKF